MAACALPAAAHDLTHTTPDEPGWRIEAAAALRAVAADARWPTPSWPGVLTTGSAQPDARGLSLEHASLAAGLRLTDTWATYAAVGAHGDGGGAHVEAAALQGRWLPAPDARLTLSLGRDRVRLGGSADTAGQYDAFTEPPLALTAVLNDTWTSDGLRAVYEPLDHALGLRAVEVGVWRGAAFPSSPGSPPTLSARSDWAWSSTDTGAWQASLGAALARPVGRGAALQGTGFGHTHGALDCRQTLAQMSCFDGTSRILAATLAWASADGRWRLAGSSLARWDAGDLATTSAAARIASRVHGVWLDAAWQPLPGWWASARAERLTLRHDLVGAGATALARDAGLAGAEPVARFTAALAWEPTPGWRLGVEAVRERGASAVSHAALRLVWQPRAWEGLL